MLASFFLVILLRLSLIAIYVSAGLDTAPRLQQINTSVQSAIQAQALALRGGNLGGPPLILSPRLQQIPTTTSMAGAILNGGPPPLISADQTQQLPYALYGIDYGNYAGLTSPLLADYQAHADAAGGLFARWNYITLLII